MPESSTGQIVDDLMRPEAYPHPASEIGLRETHGALVFLAGEYAYKLKKAVNLGFFDFSTPELRAEDAEREVQLNRRLAPTTYLGVVDVVRGPEGRHSIGGPGASVERAVWMRRLPEDGMLTSLLQRGLVTSSLVRRIARQVARFHSAARTGPGVDEFGALSALAANWQENFDQLREFIGVTVPRQEMEIIRAFVERTLALDADRIERRIAEGRVRDGHGDLHAGSICLHGRDVVIFDCIEFSPRYRCGDVAAEIAFLAMDLQHAGRPDLAWTFVDEYVRVSGDSEIWTLLDFFACYRAVVRGKVLSIRFEQESDPDARQQIAAQARSYFDLATAYAGGICRPLLLVVRGLPASGKTTLANALSGRLGLMHVSSDVTRKRLAGLLATERAGSPFGAGLYESKWTDRTYGAMRRQAARWLDRGVSVILDGTFSDSKQLALATRLAQRTGVHLLVVETTCDDADARRRLARRAATNTDPSDANWDIYAKMRGAYSTPRQLANGDHYVDSSGGGGASDVVRHLIEGRQDQSVSEILEAASSGGN
ncbi:MAG: hypothetical protein HW416_586 [Chloroflexi bacterium]|nr:hypothetical protein [Chloroflexota bacterium]